jgi:uncharacterized protein (DUF486 family)
MSAGLWSISLLILSNVFMTLAWYGHLQLHKSQRWSALPLLWRHSASAGSSRLPNTRCRYPQIVSAVRITVGPFNLFELKVIQEVISLLVFTVFAVWIFKSDELRWNYMVGFVFLILAVFFIFKRW